MKYTPNEAQYIFTGFLNCADKIQTQCDLADNLKLVHSDLPSHAKVGTRKWETRTWGNGLPYKCTRSAVSL